MAKPFANLASDMLRLSGRLPLNTNNAVKAISAAVHEEEVLAMPVDTARSRSNWVASLHAPFDGELEPYAPGRHLGIAETANAESAIQQGRNVIGSRLPGPGTVYLTNNVEYLDDIHSPQIGFQPISSVVSQALLTGVGRVTIRALLK